MRGYELHVLLQLYLQQAHQGSCLYPPLICVCVIHSSEGGVSSSLEASDEAETKERLASSHCGTAVGMSTGWAAGMDAYCTWSGEKGKPAINTCLRTLYNAVYCTFNKCLEAHFMLTQMHTRIQILFPYVSSCVYESLICTPSGLQSCFHTLNEYEI